MKKRILVLATVAALMAVMLMAMAPAAMAEPPAGDQGCDGGLTNANHAVFQTSVSDHMKSGDAPGTQDNRGLDTARETGPIGFSENCQVPDAPGQQ